MKKVVRSTVLGLVVVAGSIFAAPAQAAPECQGASGVVQCWPERVRECISNLALPPRPC